MKTPIKILQKAKTITKGIIRFTLFQNDPIIIGLIRHLADKKCIQSKGEKK